jgi:hypothetical protein
MTVTHCGSLFLNASLRGSEATEAILQYINVGSKILRSAQDDSEGA